MTNTTDTIKLEEIQGYLAHGLKVAHIDPQLNKGYEILALEGLIYRNRYHDSDYKEITFWVTGNYGLNSTAHDVKPILRKLEDMTEEEKREWNRRKQRKGYMIQVHADNTQWLYSRHFDIHNLIPRGLAIDITTLQSPNGKATV